MDALSVAQPQQLIIVLQVLLWIRGSYVQLEAMEMLPQLLVELCQLRLVVDFVMQATFVQLEVQARRKINAVVQTSIVLQEVLQLQLWLLASIRIV